MNARRGYPTDAIKLNVGPRVRTFGLLFFLALALLFLDHLFFFAQSFCQILLRVQRHAAPPTSRPLLWHVQQHAPQRPSEVLRCWPSTSSMLQLCPVAQPRCHDRFEAALDNFSLDDSFGHNADMGS